MVLCFHDRLSCSLWRRLVQISNSIEVGFTAAGFGLVGTGISLLREWWPLALILVIIGALLLCAGIGNNINRVIIRLRKLFLEK